ncbi:MAG: hypothetical protein PWP23_1721 [Candidatus Sumerlaeota bacterium]|nr:hypothetical protein [Candidatus Sumerlaeota bacterium]
MPHVVHVYKDYWPPIVGGIERCIHWMATGAVREHGWEATVLVNARGRESRERESDGVRIVEVGEWGRALSAPISPRFPLAMRNLKADVWHFHLPNPTGDVSYLLTRPKGRVVATYHSDVVRQKWAMAAYGPFLNAFLRRCDCIMPTSPRLIDASAVLTRFRAKCTPVPLGMPLEKFARTAAAAQRAREVRRQYKGFPLIVFVGVLRYYKGLQFLISAMRGLPRVQAVLIGDGPEREPLKGLAEELGVGDRIAFPGFLDDEEMIAHLHAADVYVLPSHLPAEAYGLSQIEAMAAGLPVVSCDLPTGVPFVNLHKETGLIVPPADDEALAQAIAELLSNQSQRLHMAETALRRAHAEFTDTRMNERVMDVYRQVLGPS